MPAVSPEAVARLLDDPECPTIVVHRADGKSVPVLAFIAFARSRGLPTSGIEAIADSIVAQRGGERTKVIDPWGWLPNLLRRLTGNLTTPMQDIWHLPPAS